MLVKILRGIAGDLNPVVIFEILARQDLILRHFGMKSQLLPNQLHPPIFAGAGNMLRFPRTSLIFSGLASLAGATPVVNWLATNGDASFTAGTTASSLPRIRSSA
jgi:hypothetical protein